MNLDWARLRAVVIESDDWGLCAWSPDEQAHRALADTPAFRTAAGRRYGGSTLESAADVRDLAALLRDFRGGDGFAPVLQANIVLAAPDYAVLAYARFEVDALPLLFFPKTPGRWQRPGLWDEVRRAMGAGVWWPELHGLHHLPETVWLAALRRGADDARRAFEQQSPVCAAVEASSEYDPDEPAAVRERNLTRAVEAFTALFGRTPTSICPPDYRWDEYLEAQSEALGIPAVQGKSEQHGARLPRLRRAWHERRWPRFRHRQLFMPPRVAFEPAARDPRTGVEAAHGAVRAAWGRGQPAVLSTHRVNYVHLDADASRSGRDALRDLFGRLAADRAVFLTDAEVTGLVTSGWSLRPLGDRAAVLRFHSVPGEPVRFRTPAGVTGATLIAGRHDGARLEVSGGEVEMRVNVGEYEIEWLRS